MVQQLAMEAEDHGLICGSARRPWSRSRSGARTRGVRIIPDRLRPARGVTASLPTPRASTPPLALDSTAPGPSSLAYRQPPLPHRVDLSQPRGVPARSRPTRHSCPSAAHRRRPASQVQPLDDRHGIAPILCRRTLRPRHDASRPQLCHQSVPPLLFQVVPLKIYPAGVIKSSTVASLRS